MPKFIWGLNLLLVMALISSYVVPLEAALAPTNLTEVYSLLQHCWQIAEDEYQKAIVSLVEKHLNNYYTTGGYGDMGIYIEEIGSGLQFGHNAERTELRPDGTRIGYFHTASVAKLLIAYVFYHLDDLGEEDIWSIHVDPVVGQQQQWQPLIHRMITHSVNLHHNIMLRYLGAERATATLRRLGLTHSTLTRELAPAPGTSNATCWERYGTLEPPRTSPFDLGRLLASLARGDVLSAENNELFLEALTSTIYNSRIPQAINFVVPVAHKTGTKDWVYNDAALVLLPENEFVLVLLTYGAPGRIQTVMRAIARDVYALHCQRRDNGEAARARELAAWLKEH